jgi:hypothetical protein
MSKAHCGRRLQCPTLGSAPHFRIRPEASSSYFNLTSLRRQRTSPLLPPLVHPKRSNLLDVRKHLALASSGPTADPVDPTLLECASVECDTQLSIGFTASGTGYPTLCCGSVPGPFGLERVKGPNTGSDSILLSSTPSNTPLLNLSRPVIAFRLFKSLTGPNRF